MIELDYSKAQSFLAENGVDGAKIEKIAGDASMRSYYRIFFGEKTFILMFAPPKFEDVNPFIKIDEFLIENKLCAPKIFAKDFDNGFLLLEDFGDKTFNRVLKNDASLEEKLYQNAVDCLIELHKKEIPKNVDIYNHQELFREVKLFVDWYLKYEKNVEFDFEQNKAFKAKWFEVFDKINWPQKVVVLRDYHADNLMDLDGNGADFVGLLDFQDALIGSNAYDLVSLLEDARRDVDDGVCQKMLRYYIDNAKIDEESFLRDYEILSLQRNIKILGIFARLAHRDNKMNYIEFIPRVKKYVLQRINYKSDVLKDVAVFLEKFI